MKRIVIIAGRKSHGPDGNGIHDYPAQARLLHDCLRRSPVADRIMVVRAEDDLLVVDRVGRRLMLRAGSAVVGVWNEAFDLNGVPPAGGTTVTGVERVLKADVDGTPRRVTARETAHE